MEWYKLDDMRSFTTCGAKAVCVCTCTCTWVGSVNEYACIVALICLVALTDCTCTCMSLPENNCVCNTVIMYKHSLRNKVVIHKRSLIQCLVSREGGQDNDYVL